MMLTPLTIILFERVIRPRLLRSADKRQALDDVKAAILENMGE